MTIQDRISALAAEIDQLRCLATYPNISLETNIIWDEGRTVHAVKRIEPIYTVHTNSVSLKMKLDLA